MPPQKKLSPTYTVEGNHQNGDNPNHPHHPHHHHHNNCDEYIPLAAKIQRRIAAGPGCAPFFSVEFFPPKTKNAAINLVKRFDNFRQLGPLFADITWHAAGNPESDSATSSITIAGVALNYCWLDTMLHITCVGIDRRRLTDCLERAKSLGIRSILALRGDRPSAEAKNSTSASKLKDDFRYAIDLVRFIRENYADYFTIAVAGYPTPHPESANRATDIAYLKAKVDAGADFIVTQLFFEFDVFASFVADCRAAGITAPILPGIMPIQNYDSLEKIARISCLTIPEQVLRELAPIKGNDEAVRNYGIDWTVRLCRQILNAAIAPGLHFYTLNREQATVTIVKALNLAATGPTKSLPWSSSPNHRRRSETVRPIFWSSRPKSYVHRTDTWDEYPNGRWGRHDSPAFGSLNDYYLFLERQPSRESLREQWGNEIRSERDVRHVFHCYISGIPNRAGNRVRSLPWNDDDGGVLRPETRIIQRRLSRVNRRGILTINSQPNVNGADSADPVFGWGSPNGYVYQKAYVEFFVDERKAERLLRILRAEYEPRVNYQMVNQRGDRFETNSASSDDENGGDTIAVTWGVFPGKEIIQPTVVDAVSFQVWKDEAFGLWLEKWAPIYAAESESASVLRHIHDTYYLVNLVDNDFPKQTCIWEILERVIAEDADQDDKDYDYDDDDVDDHDDNENQRKSSR